MLLEISFYHIIKSNIAEVLLRLVIRAQEQNSRSLLVFSTEQCLAAIDDFFWQHQPLMAHGTSLQAFPHEQPILLSLTTENINKAEICFLLECANYSDLTIFKRVILLFDGHKQAEVEYAREHWQKFKLLDCKMNYYKQNNNGSWQLLKSYVKK